ncbi:response regulator transcription factor [Paenibacillus sp. IITD108]|uniref:response regulator transcription factor n=1 Tax=Paenibacillus sp. IITD108 TaxID=3116649 RepID=UPI002F4256BC
MLSSPVILIAEDELPTRRGIVNTLMEWSQGQHTLTSAANGVEALEFSRTHRIDLLITDIKMPGLDGIELLQAMKDDGQDITSILLTGYAEFEYARSAMSLGAVNYILKPVEPAELVRAVKQALQAKARQPTIDKDKALTPVVKNEFVKKALQFIHSSLSEPSLTIREVADHIHLSSGYLSVLFKEELNMTFSDYIASRRMQLAKQLLLHTDNKIYEIAEAAGFSSSKYFVKAFRMNEGITPKQFRKG